MDFPVRDFSRLERLRLASCVRTGLSLGGHGMDMEISEYLGQVLDGECGIDAACLQMFDKYAVVCGETFNESYSDFDSYFYDNVATLQNKLSIRSGILLDHIEGKFTAVRMLGLLANEVPEDFSVEYFRSIHHALFQDIYTWAGCFRKCSMGKRQNYCEPGFIAQDMALFCDRFRTQFLERDFQKKLDLADELARAWAKLNKIHAFRDGNGRTQYVFFRMACMAKGYDLYAQEPDLKKFRTARDLASLGRDGILRETLFRSLHPLDGDVSQHEKARPFDFLAFGPDAGGRQACM